MYIERGRERKKERKRQIHIYIIDIYTFTLMYSINHIMYIICLMGIFHCSHDLTAQHPAHWPQPLCPSAGARQQGDPGGLSARPRLEQWQQWHYQKVNLWLIYG